MVAEEARAKNLSAHWREGTAQIRTRITPDSASDGAKAHHSTSQSAGAMRGLILSLRLDSSAHRENVTGCELTNGNLAKVFVQPVIKQPIRF